MNENSHRNFFSNLSKKCRDTHVEMSKQIIKSIDSRKNMDLLLQIFLSEVIGTAFLMYFGCMGGFSNLNETLPLPPMQGAFVFGFIVSSIIVAIGHISKAHLNPAVTLCAYILGLISPITGFIYFIAECIGGLLGVYLLKISTGPSVYEGYNNMTGGFCVTSIHSSLSIPQGILVEFLATAMLIYVVCSVWDPRNAHTNDSTAIKFGLLVTTLSIAAGPFTGASMNPARSLGPAVISNKWAKHWVYWLAPLSGSAVTTFFYKKMFLRSQYAKDSQEIPSVDQNTTVLKSSGADKQVTSAKKPEKPANIV